MTKDMKKEKIAYFKIPTLTSDNVYQAPKTSYLFCPGKYTEVYGSEDIEFFKSNNRFVEKKIRIFKTKSEIAAEKKFKVEAEAEKKAEADKETKKDSAKKGTTKGGNPLDNI